MILLIICFVSLFLLCFAWFSFRLISFRILKFLFRLEAKQAKLGGLEDWRIVRVSPNSTPAWDRTGAALARSKHLNHYPVVVAYF